MGGPPGVPPHPGLGGGPTWGTPHPGLGGGPAWGTPHPGLGRGPTQGTPPSRSRWGACPGYPPPSRSRWGAHPGYPPPHQEQHSVYLLHGSWYASCIHTGGLSCLNIFLHEIKIKICKIYTAFPVFFANVQCYSAEFSIV